MSKQNDKHSKEDQYKEHRNTERHLSNSHSFDISRILNTGLLNSKTALICTSCCFCFIVLYLAVVGSLMGVIYVETADENLVSCQAPQWVSEMNNTCLSNNDELDLTVSSTVWTQIEKCTTGKRNAVRCEMPTTFVFYDLLSMSRMTNRVGYSSQCALEGSQPVEQREAWMQIPLDPNDVYWSDGTGMTAAINGSLLAYVPLCNSHFVEQPVGVNLTMNNLQGVILQGYVDIPLVKAFIEGTVHTEYQVGWYDYSAVWDIESSADFSLTLLATVSATDILLEHPSINGLLAVKSGSVSATLNISELGEIYNFSITVKNSTACDDSQYDIDLCPYMEDFIYDTLGPELLNLVLLYAEVGFADLANILAEKVQNATYTEVDFWGLESTCSIVQCNGETLYAFVTQLHFLAWMHIGLFSILFILAYCSLYIFKRSRGYSNVAKSSSEVESNSLLYCRNSERYGSVE